jgi:hypothetical protein
MYSHYGIGQSLLQVPLYWAGSRFFPGYGAEDPWHAGQPYATYPLGAYLCIALENCLAGGLVAAWLYRVCRRWFSTRAALQTVAVAVFGTMIWPYARQSFGELWLAACLLGATWHLLEARPAGAAFWLGLGFNFKPVVALPILVGTLYLLRRPVRRGSLLAYGMVLAGWVGLALWYNWIRFGSLFEFGYERGFALSHLGVMPYNYLLNPAYAIWIYAPPLVLAATRWPSFWRRHTQDAALLLAVALSYFLPYLAWHDPGQGWGPRLFLPALPLLLLPLGLLWPPSWQIFAVGALGILAQLPAVLFDPSPALIRGAVSQPILDGGLWLQLADIVRGQAPIDLWFLREYPPGFWFVPVVATLGVLMAAAGALLLRGGLAQLRHQ